MDQIKNDIQIELEWKLYVEKVLKNSHVSQQKI